MKYTPPTFTALSEMAAIDVSRLTEDEARDILENIRWPNGPICPHCGSISAIRLQGTSPKTRDGLLQCRDCRKQFSVTVGTIMHGSHITLRQWIQAFYSICSHKKGVSALQLQRNLGLRSYRSAWYLAHRIREAMQHGLLADLLSGTVEVDETYVGGKPRKNRIDENGNPVKSKRGRGTDKTPVIALVERDGRSATQVIDGTVTAENLKQAIHEHVNREAAIMTDELNLYNGIGSDYAGGHRTVNHGKGEYVKGLASTNTSESFFALLKRGVHGTFHHVSKQHLQRYCNEFSFRWDWRKVTDGERTTEAIKGIEGKRMPYMSLVGRKGTV